MTVESNYVIAITTLSDCLKRVTPVFQPIRSKTKTNLSFPSSLIQWLIMGMPIREGEGLEMGEICHTPSH